MRNVLKKVYFDLIVSKQKELTFWIFSAFLPTFIVERALVYIFPQMFVDVRGVHIHHFAWGILILAICGYLALFSKTHRQKVWIAIFYGIGLSLAFDELGMWLRLTDNYFLRQSYDAMLVILAWLINAVYFSDFWLSFGKTIFNLTFKNLKST